MEFFTYNRQPLQNLISQSNRPSLSIATKQVESFANIVVIAALQMLGHANLHKPSVLFIDAFDSFSNNIIDLVQDALKVAVTKITIDHDLPSNVHESYSAIIIGPGPGSPYISSDVGCINQVWDLAQDELVPVLGICFGFQSLVLRFGGSVPLLPYPRHGIETDICGSNDSIFKDIHKFRSVQYHSRYASINGQQSQPNPDNLWTPNTSCPDLVPLAWDIDHPYSRNPPTKDDPRASIGALNPSHILMSVKHATKPFYGIQFHPESICSSPDAHQVVVNWWHQAKEWNSNHRNAHWHGTLTTIPFPKQFFSRSIQLGNLDVPAVRTQVQEVDEEVIVLDSEMSQTSELGVYTIIGLIDNDTLNISYITGQKHVHLRKGDDSVTQSLSTYGESVFAFLDDFMKNRRQLDGNQDTPFWGGLMGYISYEAGLETLKIPTTPRPSRPDIQFAFVERSIVINHVTCRLYVQSIKEHDDKWVEETVASLNQLAQSNSKNSTKSSLETLAPSNEIQLTIPAEHKYYSRIRKCHEQIRQGNSYELCLTDKTRINMTSPFPSAWSHYLRLRAVNPAPFGAYIRLRSLTIMSSSPERFMSWSRSNGLHESTCQFRPIKGTVQKRVVDSAGNIDLVDLVSATQMLSTSKERAENLMIVDLIRHDLAGVVGSGNVRTKSLMQVEEYESVYQLVSVIEGTLKPTSPQTSGINVLAASLPPGSMTGAPKKRSCELLQRIEDNVPRSIYSGVMGYMDVGGGGDFSIAIRNAYSWDDETTKIGQVWTIGAGGAITDLSNERAEWDEMYAKLDAVLRSFAKT